MLRLLLIGAGAITFAVIVWTSVAADALQLVSAAGWWSLVALAWPTFIGVGVWRGWGR